MHSRLAQLLRRSLAGCAAAALLAGCAGGGGATTVTTTRTITTIAAGSVWNGVIGAHGSRRLRPSLCGRLANVRGVVVRTTAGRAASPSAARKVVLDAVGHVIRNGGAAPVRAFLYCHA